jgi:hypothetical protein
MHMSAGDAPRPPVFGRNIWEVGAGSKDRRPKTELVVYCKKEKEMGEVRTEITLVNIGATGREELL